MRILYACQKCGDEVGEGEQDHIGRHAICGGSLDPIGECPHEPEALVPAPPKQRDFEKEAIEQIARETQPQEEGKPTKGVEYINDLLDAHASHFLTVAVRYCSKWLEAEGLIQELLSLFGDTSEEQDAYAAQCVGSGDAKFIRNARAFLARRAN